MTTHKLNLLPLLFIILIPILSSCSKKDSIYYQFKILQFSREPDTVQHYMLNLERIRYNKINDSTIVFFSIIDSLKNWDSTSYKNERNKSDYDTYFHSELDSVWKLNEKLFSSLKHDEFYFHDLNNVTRIISLHTGDENDTLYLELKRKYNNLNIYSFYYRFGGFDGDYRLYFCDNIGLVASYSGAWNNLSILDKIINADKLDSKWEITRSQLLQDTSFFPGPKDLIKNVIYIPPHDNK